MSLSGLLCSADRASADLVHCHTCEGWMACVKACHRVTCVLYCFADGSGCDALLHQFLGIPSAVRLGRSPRRPNEFQTVEFTLYCSSVTQLLYFSYLLRCTPYPQGTEYIAEGSEYLKTCWRSSYSRNHYIVLWMGSCQVAFRRVISGK